MEDAKAYPHYKPDHYEFSKLMGSSKNIIDDTGIWAINFSAT